MGRMLTNKKFAKSLILFFYLSMIFMFAINNTFDFNTNYEFVKHVLSMDTTFNPNSIRAIHNKSIHLLAYLSIIAWQYLTFVVGLLGLKEYCSAGRVEFINASLMMAITLYFFGYIIVASEWFMMWQSSKWNGKNTAFMFTMLLILILNLINSHNEGIEASK